MEQYIKNFKQWAFRKEKLHYSNRNTPSITEGEVWWCSIGANIGNEIDGKSRKHSRPVLVFKKFSHDSFLGIPVTSQPKIGTWFVSVTFQGNREVFILNQARSFSTKRLTDRIGVLDEQDFIQIKTGFQSLIFPELVDMCPSVFQEGSREIPENLPLGEIPIGSSLIVANKNVSSSGTVDPE